MTRAWLTPLPATMTVTALLAVLTGCGSSSNTSPGGSSSTPATTAATSASSDAPAGWVASVEAICAKRNSTIAAFNLKIESEARFKTVAHQIATAEQAALTELSKLTAPATTQPAWTQFLNDRQALIKAWHKVATQGLYDGLPTSPNHKTNMTAVVATQTKLLTTAQHDGYKNCTQQD